MKNEKLLKGLGFLATVIGFGATLLSNYVGEKNQEIQIDEKVAKALAEQKKDA